MVLTKINNVIYRVMGVIAGACLFAIVCIVAAQVFSRYLFKLSIVWSSELTVYMLTWMVFMGCAMGYRSNSIATLTLLTNRFPVKVRKTIEIIIHLILLFFFAVTFVTNLETVRNASQRLSSILKVNLAFVSVSWNVCSAIMILFAIEKILFIVRNFNNDIEEDSAIVKAEEVNR
ncbi:MAG: TRAP transporter small permease [Lachnospiraceae bacterium]|nr:TRAP transporter small permease [Lachnospiraceae bacterium]